MGASGQVVGVKALAEPIVAACGLVLEDVQVTPAGKRRVLRLTVDLPAERTGGVDLDLVARASAELSAALDRSDVMGGSAYVLEVSSPGADRPLTERRHWSRARGRRVEVRLVGGGVFVGRLAGVDDGGLSFAEGAPLPWGQVSGGQVVLDFDRAAGADDLTAIGRMADDDQAADEDAPRREG